MDAEGKITDSVVVDLAVPEIIDFEEYQVKMPIDKKNMHRQHQIKKNEANALWDKVKDEIDENNPFVLNMWHGGKGSGHPQQYG